MVSQQKQLQYTDQPIMSKFFEKLFLHSILLQKKSYTTFYISLQKPAFNYWTSSQKTESIRNGLKQNKIFFCSI